MFFDVFDSLIGKDDIPRENLMLNHRIDTSVKPAD